jgi:hypothetical protein
MKIKTTSACNLERSRLHPERASYRAVKTWFKIMVLLLTVLTLETSVFSARDLKAQAEGQIETKKEGLTASLDRNSAPVGSIVTLNLKYHLPEKDRLPDNFRINGLENLTLVDQKKQSGLIKARLLVDKLGSWKTGPLTLVWVDKNNKEHILKTSPVSLKVLSNLGDKPEEARLKPIHDIIPSKPQWVRTLAWTLACIMLLSMIFVLIWWFKNKRSKIKPAGQAPPPHVVAKRDLKELEASRLFEKGHVKEYYFRMSVILRRYLEAIRGFHAAEFTTEEIARVIKTEEDRKLLQLLRQADLVKFSNAIPTPDRKEHDRIDAGAYIEATTPVTELKGKNSTNGTDADLPKNPAKKTPGRRT